MMVASAVIVPETELIATAPETVSPPQKKRRQSSHSSTSSTSKRPRLEDKAQESTNGVAAQTNGAHSAAPPPSAPASDRRKSAINVNDRQRSRRLFGALLGPAAKPANSTSKANPAQQRRQEAEKKQAARQAELAAHAEEDTRTLLAQREADQKLWDEQSQRLLWESERFRAPFLRTSGRDGECVIYWRPWDMTDSQKKIVEEQVREQEAKIVGEGGEAMPVVSQDAEKRGSVGGESGAVGTALDGADEAKPLSPAAASPPQEIPKPAIVVDEPVVAPETTEGATATELLDMPVDKDLTDDAEGEDVDVVVEAGEDAVIY